MYSLVLAVVVGFPWRWNVSFMDWIMVDYWIIIVHKEKQKMPFKCC
jgi:hypothetical protein